MPTSRPQNPSEESPQSSNISNPSWPQVMRTEWLMTCPGGTCGRFGPNPTSVGINAHGREQVVRVRVNSGRPYKIAAQDAEMFRASPEAMYQTTVNERLPPGPGKAQAVQCRKLPLHQPVFNESWADGALYRGVHYLDGQLCHRWSNTVAQTCFHLSDSRMTS